METNTTTPPSHPLQSFKRSIAEQIAGFAGVTVDQALECVEDGRNLKMGDLTLPLPKLNKHKKLEGKPLDLVKKWAEEFKRSDMILDVVTEGTYLHFKVNKTSILKELVNKVYKEQASYGSSDVGKGQKVIVEFSSPNIAKPFHAGHLRSTIIGNFIKNLHKALGYDVHSINYLGDWGKQYGLLAIGFNKFGNEKELIERPIKHLFDVYVQINQVKETEEKLNEESGKGKISETDDAARAYFKRMEDGDPEALAMWKKFRDLSIVEYKKIYARLNVEYDEYSGESLFGNEMEKEVAVLEEKGLLKDNQGAKIIDLKEEKLDVALVKKKDGATLYITRDIAAAHFRKEKYNFNKMFYVVAAQQNHHFNQLFVILKKMGYTWYSDCTHINFGMVKGMSTRKGNVVFLSDILDGAQDKMLEVMKKNEKKYAEIEDPLKTADIIGLSAVIIQDLSARRIKDYVYDEERMTSFEGDTGPYLQYTHTRLCSMQRKAKADGIDVNVEADLSLITEQEVFDILTLVGKYPSVLLASQADLQPSVIVTYLLNLSHAVSAALEKIRVIGIQNSKVAEARLIVYFCAKIALGNGLKLLGLAPLERM